MVNRNLRKSKRLGIVTGIATMFLFVSFLPSQNYQANPMVDEILCLVLTVEDMNIQSGISNSLDAKLNAALNALDDLKSNNDIAALNSMDAFANAVEAQRGKQISEVDADILIFSRHKSYQPILRGIRILIFVDQDVTIAILIFFEDFW